MLGENHCLPSYETYIDIVKHGHVKYDVWFFFQKLEVNATAKCKNWHIEINYGSDTVLLVEHLKRNHNANDGPGFNYSHENYLEHLKQSLEFTSYDFPHLQTNHLKLSFGVRYADKFTIVRFPECRKGWTIYPEKDAYKSTWQRKVCKTYLENPVGCYQGHFDRPITVKVHTGMKPLSFEEYTEFTHTPCDDCHKYEINKNKYEALDDLKKLEKIEVSTQKDSLSISGLCSRYDNQSILYSCIHHKCIFPCVCKDCVHHKFCKFCRNEKHKYDGIY